MIMILKKDKRLGALQNFSPCCFLSNDGKNKKRLVINDLNLFYFSIFRLIFILIR